MKNHTEEISKIKPFINNYNWKEISFSSHKKKIGKSLNLIISESSPLIFCFLKILKRNETNFNRENKVISLLLQMVKSGIILLQKSVIKRKNIKAWWWLLSHQLSSFITIENKLKAPKNVCKSHDYCHIQISEKGKKTNKINHGECYMKVLFVICADTESFLEKIDTCHNSPEKSSITK